MNIIHSYGIDVLQTVIAWVLSLGLFSALIVYIAKHPQKRTIPLKATFIIMFLGGMAVYCTCHFLELKGVIAGGDAGRYLEWVKDENAYLFRVPYVIVSSVIDVGMMFYGRCNTDLFYKMPFSANPAAVLVFWLIHLVAFYTTATALLIRFGNDILRWIRIMTTKISDVDIVFGVNSDSLALGRNLADVRGYMLV